MNEVETKELAERGAAPFSQFLTIQFFGRDLRSRVFLLVNFGYNFISGAVRGGWPSLRFIVLWMQDGNTVDKFTYVQETETED